MRGDLLGGLQRVHDEVIGRPLDDQLRIEALYGYSIMDNPEIDAERERFLAEGDPR